MKALGIQLESIEIVFEVKLLEMQVIVKAQDTDIKNLKKEIKKDRSLVYEIDQLRSNTTRTTASAIEQPFRCDHCEYSSKIKTKKGLKSHVTKKHGAANPVARFCRVC